MGLFNIFKKVRVNFENADGKRQMGIFNPETATTKVVFGDEIPFNKLRNPKFFPEENGEGLDTDSYLKEISKEFKKNV